MRRTTAGIAAVAAALLLLTSSCATEKQSQYTATGAGIGAVTGAALGAILGSFGGRAGEGAVIGSIFGGLAGASIGNNEYHMQRSEELAARQYDYDTARARTDLVRIEDAYADPKTVAPGDTVNLVSTFTVLTPYRRLALVHEVREVRNDVGEIIGRPEVTERREGGTWTSSMPLKIPESARPGRYRVTTIVETDSAGDTREFAFQVEEPQGQWRR
jgi:outer membrane lipoprotein SlyB